LLLYDEDAGSYTNDEGNRNNPTKGGTGRIFIDDICLAKP